MSDVTETAAIDLHSAVKDILDTVEREREREIIARRFGLYDRKETLEQIGELLGITRERVRQLEKSVMSKLTTMADKDLPHVEEISAAFVTELSSNGKIAKISDLSGKLTKDNSKIDQSRIAFLARLTPSITFISENDHFHNAAALATDYSEKG